MDYTMGLGGQGWMNCTLAEELLGVYAEVKWIQVITAILSVLGSGSIIGYAVFHNAVRSPEIRPLFYLSLSDLLLALCWLLGAILHGKTCSHSCHNCYNLQAVGQMFYVSTSFYTLNYMWQTFINMKRKLDSNLYKVYERECCIGRITTILSSVIPVLFTMPVLIIGNQMECYGNSSHSCLVLNVGSPVTTRLHNDTDHFCKGLHDYSTAVFLLTFCLTAIPILAIIGHSQSVLQRHLATSAVLPDHQWAGVRVISWSLLLFPAIFFLCRLPAVLLALLTLSGNEGTHTFYIILYFIQALTAVSPGFFNFLAYGGMRRMLWDLKQRGFRDVDTQTPLLRSQKKLYASMQTSASDIRAHNVSAF